MTTILRVGCAVLLFAPFGCSKDCCTRHEDSYRISGAAPDGASQCPALLLDVYEGTSTQCSENCTVSGSSPGKLVLEKQFASSSNWSVDVPVTYVDDKQPSLDVYAYCDENQNGQVDADDPCLAFTSLGAGDHESVKLDHPSCPRRL